MRRGRRHVLPRLRFAMVRDTGPQILPPREGVRNLVPADDDALAALMYIAYLGTVDDLGTTPDEAARETQSTFQGVYGTVLWGCSFVVEDQEQLTAACVVTRYANGRDPLIAFTMTHPEHQRRGLASHLLRRSIGTLYHNGCTRVFLHVTAANRGALTLYEKLGFQRHREYLSET